MRKKNKRNHVIFIGAIMILGIIILADLFYKFGNYDTPFFFVFLILLLLLLKNLITSRSIFIVSFVLLLSMGTSYIQVGGARLTERLGEWFFIVFVFGLLASTIEYVKVRNRVKTLVRKR